MWVLYCSTFTHSHRDTHQHYACVHSLPHRHRYKSNARRSTRRQCRTIYNTYGSRQRQRFLICMVSTTLYTMTCERALACQRSNSHAASGIDERLRSVCVRCTASIFVPEGSLCHKHGVEGRGEGEGGAPNGFYIGANAQHASFHVGDRAMCCTTFTPLKTMCECVCSESRRASQREEQIVGTHPRPERYVGTCNFSHIVAAAAGLLFVIICAIHERETRLYVETRFRTREHTHALRADVRRTFKCVRVYVLFWHSA